MTYQVVEQRPMPLDDYQAWLNLANAPEDFELLIVGAAG